MINGQQSRSCEIPSRNIHSIRYFWVNVIFLQKTTRLQTNWCEIFSVQNNSDAEYVEALNRSFVRELGSRISKAVNDSSSTVPVFLLSPETSPWPESLSFACFMECVAALSFITFLTSEKNNGHHLCSQEWLTKFRSVSPTSVAQRYLHNVGSENHDTLLTFF